MAEAYPAAGCLPVFNVVLFNTEQGSDVYVNAECRNSCIQEMLQIIQSECPEPLFILFQELKQGQQHVFGKSLLTKHHYCGGGDYSKAEAGYAYRLHSLSKQYVITPVDIRLYYAAVGLPPEHAEYIFKGQSAFVLTLNNEDGKNILCVSWHGPYIKKDIEKQALFRTLIRLLERLRVRKACDGVLIGGDFNLPFHKVVGDKETLVSVLPLKSLKTFDNIQVCIIGLTVQDRNNVIDYIVYWPVDLYDDTCQPRDLRRDYMKKSPRPFDHPVLLYRLQFHQKTVHEVLMECLKGASSRAANYLTSESPPEWTIRLYFNLTHQPTEKEELFEIRGSCLANLVVKTTVEKENRVYLVEKKEITVFQYFGARSSRIPKRFEKQMKELTQMTEDHRISVEWYLSSVWRPCPALEGISGANTKLFCLWCHCVTGVPDRRPTGSDGANGDPQELLPWVGFNPPWRTECLLQKRISRILFSMVVSRCSSSQKGGALTRQLKKYDLISLVQLDWNVIDPMRVSAGDLKVITGNLNVKEIFGVNRNQTRTSIDLYTEHMEALTLEKASKDASLSAVPQQPAYRSAVPQRPAYSSAVPQHPAYRSEEMRRTDNMQELLTSFHELMEELHSSDTIPNMTSDAIKEKVLTFRQKAKDFAGLFRQSAGLFGQSAAADTDVTLYSSCLENHAPHAYEIRLRQRLSLPTTEPAIQACHSTNL